MTTFLLDTSVLVKWFDTRGEDEVAEAEALRLAHTQRRIALRLLDLAIYELANVLLRRRSWPPDAVADSVEDVVALLPEVVPVSTSWAREALRLAERHGLTAYEACWAAAARDLGVPLLSADRQLVDAGLAESATSAANRLGLLP